MLDVTLVMERLDLGTSRHASVQRVQQVIAAANDPKTEAEKLILQIIGVEHTYASEDLARITAKCVVDKAWQQELKIDNVEEFMHMCEKRAEAFVKNPANAFHFVKPQLYQAAPTIMKQVSQEVDVKVEVKTDGSIKKGGKQVIAAELYKKHVLTSATPLSNQQFIKLLMKECDLSKPGATTYAYNCKKAQGEPEGGMIKSNKGRKPAAK